MATSWACARGGYYLEIYMGNLLENNATPIRARPFFVVTSQMYCFDPAAHNVPSLLSPTLPFLAASPI